MSVRSRGSLWTASKPRILMDRYFQEKTNSFRTGEAANSGLSRMQLGFVSLSCRTAFVPASRLDLPDEMVQPVLALFQEPRPKARHDTLARELRYAAVSVRKGFNEVLAKEVKLGVSGERSVGMSPETYHGILLGQCMMNALREDPTMRSIAMHSRYTTHIIDHALTSS
jgi:hypothetical protein